MSSSVCHVCHLVVFLPWRTRTHDILQQFVVTDGDVEVVNVAFPLSCISLRPSPALVTHT